MSRFGIGLMALSMAAIGAAQIDLTKTANYKTFAKEVPMAAEHRALLAKNQFVVSPAPGLTEMSYVLDQNDYQNIPSLITIDVPLHLYHVLFDATLRTTETSSLYPRTQALTRQMIAATKKAYDAASDAEVKEAHLRNLAYFGVADRLLGGTAQLPAEALTLVNRELDSVKAHAGMVESPIFGTEVDYSQFIVRGHYTRSATLGRYFQGMMWYGLVPFAMCPAGRIEPDNRMVLRALALSQVFNSTQAAGAWNAIYEPTTLFAGKVNSLTPQMVWQAWKKTGGQSIGDEKFYAALCQELFKVNPSLYKPNMELRPNASATGLQLRFMPQRGLLDGLAISRVTKPVDRPLPSGLDVMNILGSVRAGQILDASPNLYNPNGWTDYVKNRTAMGAEMAAMPASTWNENLYNAWLDTLRQVVTRPKHAVPPFMKTQAFLDKGLTTALASYAELRHDTLLYGEQTAAEMGDGEEEQPYVRQYVEPNLAVYERLAWMNRALKEGLGKYKLLTPESSEDVSQYGMLIALLQDCAKKEVAGTPLPKATHNRLRKIGGEIDYLTTQLLMRGTNYQTLTANDRDMALVADIHSADPLAFTIASGHADDIIAVVPIEGKNYLARGSVMSYYEFTVPMSERLTDDAWKQMLADGKQPARPKWAQSYLTMKPAREVVSD